MWEPSGLPLGREVLANLFAPDRGVHLQKELVIVKAPLILVMYVTWLHIDLTQLEDEATP